MTKLAAVAFASGLAVLSTAPTAFAGSITGGAEVKINGHAPTLPVALAKGDVVETGSRPATFTSDAGDAIQIDAATRARWLGVEDGVEYLFVESGGATGTISDKTTIGVATSWATTLGRQKAVVHVEAPASRAANEGLFRTVSGDGAWLRNHAYSIWLPVAHVVVLRIDDLKPGMLHFLTSQQNGGKVAIETQDARGSLRVLIPRAVSGEVEDLSGERSKVSNEISSNRTQKVRIEVDFGFSAAADLAPGTEAVIDRRNPVLRSGSARTFTADQRVVPAFDASEERPGSGGARGAGPHPGTPPAPVPAPGPPATAGEKSPTKEPVPPPFPKRPR